ncbi:MULTISPECIES: polyprenyl diphosphate synthase [Methanoculleus]|uniref:Tritrans,polycis-undecaprenyl-diphosphate synthase (geranylgeranyl-diphosphate specific) n=2 Tax=Methanoculleus TaxID=45989 RepID=A3CWG4_METMJ|nr:MULTISPECIES: polyprenyl diphosphate synthase [Methanoculleus]ABN57714.1 Undecaprenyl pyrophosphate synthetase [Methanoculleus marisnigri JR1]MCC7555600.1 di-trans,poly-cis-decaprenylcistransferase [Methanoculleus marisnigri]UYU19106.1 polyprenyl diphosphate synthase [Methanoculleus submarinus]
MLRSGVEPLYERYLKWQVKHVPRHVAVIQDGNRRFAREQGLDTAIGHRLGADATEQVLDWACELGVQHITLYTFSTENFRRDSAELESLFLLFREKFAAILRDKRVHRNRIRVQMIGDRSLLPDELLTTIDAAEEATRDYSDYFINIALAYGGRNEIVHAARSILDEVRQGAIDPAAIDPATVEAHLNRGAPIPPVDLIIRTGNDYRTSNFLPWLANGHESAVYFCAPFWPAFRKIDLLRAMRVYDQRMRLKERVARGS